MYAFAKLCPILRAGLYAHRASGNRLALACARGRGKERRLRRKAEANPRGRRSPRESLRSNIMPRGFSPPSNAGTREDPTGRATFTTLPTREAKQSGGEAGASVAKQRLRREALAAKPKALLLRTAITCRSAHTERAVSGAPRR